MLEAKSRATWTVSQPSHFATGVGKGGAPGRAGGARRLTRAGSRCRGAEAATGGARALGQGRTTALDYQASGLTSQDGAAVRLVAALGRRERECAQRLRSVRPALRAFPGETEGRA